MASVFLTVGMASTNPSTLMYVCPALLTALDARLEPSVTCVTKAPTFSTVNALGFALPDISPTLLPESAKPVWQTATTAKTQ